MTDTTDTLESLRAQLLEAEKERDHWRRRYLETEGWLANNRKSTMGRMDAAQREVYQERSAREAAENELAQLKSPLFDLEGKFVDYDAACALARIWSKRAALIIEANKKLSDERDNLHKKGIQREDKVVKLQSELASEQKQHKNQREATHEWFCSHEMLEKRLKIHKADAKIVLDWLDKHGFRRYAVRRIAARLSKLVVVSLKGNEHAQDHRTPSRYHSPVLHQGQCSSQDT